MAMQRPATVHGDRSVLVEVDHPDYERTRELLARFAEIEKSPEHVHIYRISDLSLWNALATGMSADAILDALAGVSRFELPGHLEHEVRDCIARYGVCSLHECREDDSRLRLAVRDAFVRDRLAGDRRVAQMLSPCPDGFFIETRNRGAIKQALLKIGFPVTDLAGLKPGAPLAIALRSERFAPYPYQEQAAAAFAQAGGHGVIVLPCGAGKTIVAMLGVRALQPQTLVITTGREACSQWRRELLDKTDLDESAVCSYESATKRVGPVTITTYSMLAHKGGAGPTGHLHFDRLAREHLAAHAFTSTDHASHASVSSDARSERASACTIPPRPPAIARYDTHRVVMRGVAWGGQLRRICDDVNFPLELHPPRVKVSYAPTLPDTRSDLSGQLAQIGSIIWASHERAGHPTPPRA
jgi:hypothetical protein